MNIIHIQAVWLFDIWQIIGDSLKYLEILFVKSILR